MWDVALRNPVFGVDYKTGSAVRLMATRKAKGEAHEGTRCDRFEKHGREWNQAFVGQKGDDGGLPFWNESLWKMS